MADKDIKIVLEAVDNTERAFTQLKNRLDNLQVSTRRVESRFRRLSTAINNSLKGISRSLFNLKTAIVGAFATGSVGLFTRSVVRTASEVEVLRLRLEATGVEGEKAFRELHRWASRLPISTQEAINMFITLRAYGLNPTIEQMNILVDTVLAMGGGEDVLARIGLALGQIYTGGRLAAQEMNQLANAGIPVREILAEGLGVTTQQLKELLEQGIDANTALTIIFEGLRRRFQGISEEYATTWDGLMARLKSVWFDFKMEVADTGAFQKLKQALEDFVNWATSKEGWAVLQDLAIATGEAIVTMVDVSIGAINLLIGGIQKLVGFINDLKMAFGVAKTEAKRFWELQKTFWKEVFRGNIDVLLKGLPRGAPEKFIKTIQPFEEDIARFWDKWFEGSLKVEQTNKALDKLRERLRQVREELNQPVPTAKRPRRRKREQIGRQPLGEAIGEIGEFEFIAGPTVTFPGEEGKIPDIAGIDDIIQGLEQAKEKIQQGQRVWEQFRDSFRVGTEVVLNSIQRVSYSLEYDLLAVLDPLSKKFLDFKDLMVSIAREIWREFLRLALIRPLLEGIMFGFGGGGGLLGFFGLGRHTGGYIPKFHAGGLAKDEVLALLKKGEFVLSKEAVNQLGLVTLNELNRGRSIGGQAIVINISAVDSKSFIDLLRRNQNALLEPIISQLRRSGQLRYELMEGL